MTTNPTKSSSRKASSRQWIARQLNDPYVALAKTRGLRSRSALKLEQMDQKFTMFKKGQAVLDLGSAPGGWLQCVAGRIGIDKGLGKLVGVDLLDIEPIAGVTIFKGDVTEQTLIAEAIEALGGRADWVISDMAANTTGHRQTDHLRTMALLSSALDVACWSLASGGGFLGKCFRGGADGEVLALMRSAFTHVRHVKPEASRSESVEIYVMATGFRGVPDEALARKE